MLIRMTHYFTKQTWQGGSRQQYTGKTKEMFLHWLQSMVMLLVITFLIKQSWSVNTTNTQVALTTMISCWSTTPLGGKLWSGGSACFGGYPRLHWSTATCSINLNLAMNQLPRSTSGSIYAILWFSHYLRWEKIRVPELSGAWSPSSSLWSFDRKAFWAKG